MDKDVKLLKQYIKIKDLETDNETEYYTNCYFCHKVIEKTFYFEVIRDDIVIGLIFKTFRLKLTLEKEVIYGK